MISAATLADPHENSKMCRMWRKSGFYFLRRKQCPGMDKGLPCGTCLDVMRGALPGERYCAIEIPLIRIGSGKMMVMAEPWARGLLIQKRALLEAAGGHEDAGAARRSA